MMQDFETEQQDLAILPKIESGPTLAEQAYETIRDAVLSLELQPGERISVQTLSRQLGISRTPLREALQRLEQDGLVAIVPYEGVHVTPILARDVEEILELRLLLESYAAESAATRLSPEELSRAEKIVEEMERAHNEGEFLKSAYIGHRLHDLLLGKVDNHRLTGFLGQLDIQYSRIRSYSAGLADRSGKSVKQHRAVLTALKARDATRAGQAMADHLLSIRDDVLSSLFPDGEDSLSSFPGDRNAGRAT